MANYIIVSTPGWSKQPLEAAVAGIAALGFGQIDLALYQGWTHINPSDLADGGPPEVQRQTDRVTRLIDQHQMRGVVSVNVGLARGDTSVDEERRRLVAVCALANALGVPVVTIRGSKRGTPVEHERQRLATLLPVASDAGLELSLEMHNNEGPELPSVALGLCEAVPGLGLTLDTSHLYGGPNQGADFSMLFPLVKHVHLRDAGMRKELLQMPPGAGCVDFAGLLRGLDALGNRGKFAIEYVESMPMNAAPGEPDDVPTNIIRMRDLLLGLERTLGVERGAAAQPQPV
jgi:sugar phosphate isomerase/epimerase